MVSDTHAPHISVREESSFVMMERRSKNGVEFSSALRDAGKGYNSALE